MKIAAIIVTFNRRDLLVENLEMLSNQILKLDSVIIVDNHGTDSTEEFINELGYGEKLPIDYHYLSENTGGAGGFSYGVEVGFKKGFDFLILMDDDGKPYDNMTLFHLVEEGKRIYKNNKYIFMNSLVTYDGTNLSFSLSDPSDSLKETINKKDVFVGDCNPFNATLISRELIEKIGYPRADFFISCDEREYMSRAKRFGAYLATVTKSIYIHPKARDEIVNISGVEYELFTNPMKEYYYLRNNICNCSKWFRKPFRAIKLYKQRKIAILNCEDQKEKRLKLCRKAVIDAILNRMGKQI